MSFCDCTLASETKAGVLDLVVQISDSTCTTPPPPPPPRIGLSLQEIQGCGNTQTCRASCTNTEPNNCCVLEDDIPSSNNYPLGFVIGSIPATDSGMDPPCFRIPATEFSFANNDINYIVVGVSEIIGPHNYYSVKLCLCGLLAVYFRLVVTVTGYKFLLEEVLN